MESKCNVCGSPSPVFLKLGAVPPIQNRFCATGEQARQFPATGASYAWCETCQHISISKDRQVEFDPRYNNDQTASRVAMAHLQDVAAEIENAMQDRAARIVEIGCGRGELLALLNRSGYSNLQGYDPAAPDNADAFIQRRYWTHSGKPEMDVLILRHTLEEIPQLEDFVRAASAALVDRGLVYCEITNASRLMRDRDIFSLYPEYSNLFTVSSLSRLLGKHGISIERVSDYYDGEWLSIWGRKNSAAWMFDGQELLEQVRHKISALPQPIVLWGVGGRGGDFLGFCQADLSLIPFVVDMSQAKQGSFVPPFGQEIVAPDRLADIAPGTILVSSRKYKNEVAAIAPANCLVMSIDELCVAR
ncbi:MAG: methyltransferase domain-containing protein [Gammaproteobacteria bacterium]|nr:methyltransferase domain-containing protein [Gammaproteobacteria bacterium]